jgi:UDP-glucose 4-epimerase
MTSVLVAGAGQIGTFVARALAQAGATVLAIDADPALGYFLRFGPRTETELLTADIRDSAALLGLITQRRVTSIVACAGYVGHDFPGGGAGGWDVNVGGIRTLAEAAVLSGAVRRLVYISSLAVYGACSHSKLSEDSPPMPNSPYGRTKAAAETLLEGYRGRGLDVRIVRSCGVFGPLRLGRGSQSARLIEKLVDNARMGRELILQTTPGAADEYLYVKDLARAVAGVTLQDGPIDAFVFNVGAGKKTTSEELTAAITEVIPNARIKLELLDGSDGHSQLPPLDIDRIARTFGFTPGFSLAQGIHDYVSEAAF